LLPLAGAPGGVLGGTHGLLSPAPATRFAWRPTSACSPIATRRSTSPPEATATPRGAHPGKQSPSGARLTTQSRLLDARSGHARPEPTRRPSRRAAIIHA
jgi:hypothetical protein